MKIHILGCSIAWVMFAAIRNAVRKIPRGKVATYGQVARAAGYPGAARQVAWALHNAAANGLPWHRVVGVAGRILLTGTAAMEQRMRLEMERVAFDGNRVRMAEHEFRFRNISRKRR